MPLPALTAHGLLPAGIHQASLREVLESRFATSTDRRKFLIDRFLDWRDQFGKTGLPLDLYLDGKFFSDKPAPSDIDVIVDISRWNLSATPSSAIASLLNHDLVKNRWSLDVWPYHPVVMPFLSLNGMKLPMPEFFQRIKPEDAHARKLGPDIRKGIVQLVP